MSNAPTPAPEGVEVHFPAGTDYCCGDALGKPNSTDPADITCRVCRSEYSYRHEALTAIAVAALQAFGDDLTRDRAAALLPMWRRYSELTPSAVERVLSQFPVRR